MKKDVFSLELRVGIFIIATIIAVFLFVITQATGYKYRGYEIGVIFDYVSGLETGSPVRVSGVRAGEVRQIEILYDATPKVLVNLRLRPDIQIARHSRITIQSLGIIGEKYIEIAPSHYKQYIRPGEIVEGENPLSLEQLAAAGQNIIVNLSEVLSDIGRITGDAEVHENIRSILADSSTAIQRIDTTFERIESLAQTFDETNRKAQNLLDSSSPRIGVLLDNANELLVSGRTRMEETLDEIKTFASAGTAAAESIEDIRETALAFGEVAGEIKVFLSRIQSEGLIAQLMTEEELLEQIKHEVILLHDATQQFKDTAEAVKELSEGMNLIVSDLKDGKGTVGRLLRSDELYMNIHDFVGEIQENPWRLFFRRR